MRSRIVILIFAALILILAADRTSKAALINGATADLDMHVTITLSDGCQMAFCSGHGANAAYAYVYSDVGGVIEEDQDGENGWDDWVSYSASASTSNGATNGDVTVNTAGFDYDIHGETIVEGLAIDDSGLGLGYAYAWPDWLQCTSPGKATVTIAYTYTLDTLETCDDAESHVYMNAFFADHAGTNRLTAVGDWTVGYGSNPNTTIVEYSRSIQAGDSSTVTDTVSWEIQIPDCNEPNSWWSLWAYGEVGVDLAPVPEPATLSLLALGGLAVVRWRRKR